MGLNIIQNQQIIECITILYFNMLKHKETRIQVKKNSADLLISYHFYSVLNDIKLQIDLPLFSII